MGIINSKFRVVVKGFDDQCNRCIQPSTDTGKPTQWTSAHKHTGNVFGQAGENRHCDWKIILDYIVLLTYQKVSLSGF